jgi:hypothetical protein
MYRQQYVADVMRLLHSYFRARGFSDSFMWAVAERAVETFWQWQLAREALRLFKEVHARELEGWEADAVSYVEYLLSQEDAIWQHELSFGLPVEVEDELELPL